MVDFQFINSLYVQLLTSGGFNLTHTHTHTHTQADQSVSERTEDFASLADVFTWLQISLQGEFLFDARGPLTSMVTRIS